MRLSPLSNDSTSLNPETLNAVAAQRFVHDDVCDVVVMGHTHEARAVFPERREESLYTSTPALGPTSCSFPTMSWPRMTRSFCGFLESLFVSRPNSTPTYAEMRVDAAGSVNHARVDLSKNDQGYKLPSTSAEQD